MQHKSEQNDSQVKQTVNNACICLFRHDLRLKDNPALTAAVNSGKPLVLAFAHPDDWPASEGAARKWWIHNSVRSLSRDIETLGGKLHLYRGSVLNLMRETGANEIHWNRAYTPEAIASDTALKTELSNLGISVASHSASLLHEPWSIKNKSGGVFKVFTPFFKHLLTLPETSEPLAAPTALNCLSFSSTDATEITLNSWGLTPNKPDWSKGFDEYWSPGEAGADHKLMRFLKEGLKGYKELRNRPDKEFCSRLSPHLAAGEISSKQIWHAVRTFEASHQTNDAAPPNDVRHFLSEICWREFSYYLLFHFPDMQTKNWKPQFDAFVWENDQSALKAWQTGNTGYPMIDAGMRQLWQTGWMHNRVRMICASFLIKHLLVDWREGESWFWDTLVDADKANNVAGWQWVAGSGADASPYFRIFNPFTQGEKFDPNGDYIRTYVPELASLPNELIHRPWEATPLVLAAAGIKLGETYPTPLIEHSYARQRALAAYQETKNLEAKI